MWAGGHLAFRRPLVLGASVTRTSTIRSITPRAGRTGDLCFVIVEHEFRTGDAVCVEEQQTIVYRERALGPENYHGIGGPESCRRISSVAARQHEPLSLLGSDIQRHRIHL